jgi:hypothetical protein
MKGNHVVHTSSYIYISFFFSLIHIIVKTKIALLYFFFHSSDLKYIKWENKRKESWVYEKKEKVSRHTIGGLQCRLLNIATGMNSML